MHRFRFKYRVSVMNENTLDEVWHGRLSRFSVFMWGSGLIVLTFAILTLLILFTPIRHYLPGYGDKAARNYLLNDAVRVDSMSQQLARQQQYIVMLQQVLRGEVQPDSMPALDSVTYIDGTRLIARSDQETDFVHQYEEDEKYNLSADEEQRQDADRLVFYRPVKGAVTVGFNPAMRQYGTRIATAQGEPVMSVLRGTVVYAGLTFDDRWIISIQHEGGYVSVYKNLVRLNKRIGDPVRAGETIGVASEPSDGVQEQQITLELWKNGVMTDPEDVIAF